MKDDVCIQLDLSETNNDWPRSSQGTRLTRQMKTTRDPRAKGQGPTGHASGYLDDDRLKLLSADKS
jgi:hypothetical protein